MEADAAAADADASINFLIESKSSVFDPASGRFSLKGVSPVVAAVTAGGPAASDRGLARLVAADFYPALKGAADVVVAGDRNGTADRYFLRLSDASYDRQTASVDFKAEMRSARDAPLLKNGAVAATQAGADKDKILKVLTPTGRPISLNNVVVFADARGAPRRGQGRASRGRDGGLRGVRRVGLRAQGVEERKERRGSVRFLLRSRENSCFSLFLPICPPPSPFLHLPFSEREKKELLSPALIFVIEAHRIITFSKASCRSLGRKRRKRSLPRSHSFFSFFFFLLVASVSLFFQFEKNKLGISLSLSLSLFLVLCVLSPLVPLWPSFCFPVSRSREK